MIYWYLLISYIFFTSLLHRSSTVQKKRGFLSGRNKEALLHGEPGLLKQEQASQIRCPIGMRKVRYDETMMNQWYSVIRQWRNIIRQWRNMIRQWRNMKRQWWNMMNQWWTNGEQVLKWKHSHVIMMKPDLGGDIISVETFHWSATQPTRLKNRLQVGLPLPDPISVEWYEFVRCTSVVCLHEKTA